MTTLMIVTKGKWEWNAFKWKFIRLLRRISIPRTRISLFFFRSRFGNHFHLVVYFRFFLLGQAKHLLSPKSNWIKSSALRGETRWRIKCHQRWNPFVYVHRVSTNYFSPVPMPMPNDICTTFVQSVVCASFPIKNDNHFIVHWITNEMRTEKKSHTSAWRECVRELG